MKRNLPIRQPRKQKAIPRTRTRPRLGTQEFLDHGFKDPRSYVVTRTGRVVLRGQDKTELRLKVYRRAGGHCELLTPNGERCNKFAPLGGFGHGELVHIEASGRGGSDIAENCEWSCGIALNHATGELEGGCHRKRDHPGPQFAAQRRRAGEVGGHPEEPQPGMDADV